MTLVFFPLQCGVGFFLSLTFTNTLKISERLSSTYVQLPELLSLSVPKICWSGLFVWFCRIVFRNHGSHSMRKVYPSYSESPLAYRSPALLQESFLDKSWTLAAFGDPYLPLHSGAVVFTFSCFSVFPSCHCGADRFSMRKRAAGESAKSCTLTQPWFILDSCAGKRRQARNCS